MTTPTRRLPKHSALAPSPRPGAPAIAKQTTGRIEDGLPVRSFRTLLADLATLTRNTVVTAIEPERDFTVTARPTSLQQNALDLLGLARTEFPSRRELLRKISNLQINKEGSSV